MIPRIAIIDQNTLEATGLKSILCDMVPMADVSTFTSVEEMLQEVIRSGNFHASITPETSDAYFIVVPTPFKGDHRPDTSFVESATRMVIPFLKEDNLFVIESTSPVGTTEKMAQIIFEERPELKGKIHISYCPERVLPGNVIYELIHTACYKQPDGRDVQVDREQLPRLTDRLCQ